jgi:dienelactone hydrolase
MLRALPMFRASIGAALALCCLAEVTVAIAEDAPAPLTSAMKLKPIATPTDVYAIALRPAPPATTNSKEQWEEVNSLRTVRNVTRATLTPVLPAPDKATGAAVIVAPGGEYLMLAIDEEGYRVARWLADHGIAALVLKYRTEATPTDPSQFLTALKTRTTRTSAGPSKAFPGAALALEDARDALRVARERASEMGVDPQRIGFMGLSSSALLALSIALDEDAAARPVFVASIYGPTQARVVANRAPPLFTANIADDKLFRAGELGLAKAWHNAGAPVELHVYEPVRGVAEPGANSDRWLDAFHGWLAARGLLKSSAP